MLKFAGESYHKSIYLQFLRLIFDHTFRVIINEGKNVEWQGEKDGVFHNVLNLKANWSISYAELSLLCFISTSRTNSWVVPQNLPWRYTMSYLHNTYSNRQICGEISLCTVLCCSYSFMMCDFTICFTHEYFSNVNDIYYIIRAGLSSYLLTLLNCWDKFSFKIIYLVNPPFGA